MVGGDGEGEGGGGRPTGGVSRDVIGKGAQGVLSILCIAEQSRPTPRARTRAYTRIYARLPYPLPFRSPGLPSRANRANGSEYTPDRAPRSPDPPCATPPPTLRSRVILRSVGLQMHPRWLPRTTGMTDELQRASFCLIGVYRTFQLRVGLHHPPPFLSPAVRVLVLATRPRFSSRLRPRTRWDAPGCRDGGGGKSGRWRVQREERGGAGRKRNLLCPRANCPLGTICYKHGEMKKGGREAAGRASTLSAN